MSITKSPGASSEVNSEGRLVWKPVVVVTEGDETRIEDLPGRTWPTAHEASKAAMRELQRQIELGRDHQNRLAGVAQEMFDILTKLNEDDTIYRETGRVVSRDPNIWIRVRDVLQIVKEK